MRQISARSWCSKGKKPLKKFKTFPINRAIIPSRTFHDDDDDANATPQKRDHDDRPSSLFDDGGARPFPLFHFYAALFIRLFRAELLHRRCANARATSRGKETRFASASSSSVVWKRKRAGRKTTAQTTATGRSSTGATAASSSAATGAAARRTETTSPEQHERSGFFSNPKQ